MPRPPDEPTPDQVYDAMDPGRCYVAADLVETFEPKYDPGRRKIRRRLDRLHMENRIVKRDHTNGTVTYQRPREDEDDE